MSVDPRKCLARRSFRVTLTAKGRRRGPRRDDEQSIFAGIVLAAGGRVLSSRRKVEKLSHKAPIDKFMDRVLD